MNLKSLRLREALRLTVRTLPIMAVRLGVYMAFWFVTLVYLGLTGGIAYLVAQAVPAIGVILFLVALAGISPLYKLAKRYILYLVKAAHVAVVSELLVSGDLPEGVNQLDWGKERVQERFGEASAMFVVDELVSGVVRAFTRAVYSFASMIPGDTFQNLARVVERVIRFGLNYVDEAILARTFWRRDKSVWGGARDGVVLYGMVWKQLLVNAVALMLLSYIPFVLAFIIFAAPIGALTALISPTLAGWSIIATFVLAFLVKVALGDGFAMTAMIATYYHETKNLEPDPQIAAKLEQVSDKFRDLTERAREEANDFMVRGEDAAGASATESTIEVNEFADIEERTSPVSASED
jgi:hypothetical protein